MTCHVCKAQIASGSRYCSVCGSSTEPVAVAVSKSKVDSLLAEASLHRVRSQWADAEKRCVDIMRVDSRHVDAHILLGDIYRDQGKVDEARQWYQMAQDLDPDSPIIRDKLREVRARASRPSPRTPAQGKQVASNALGTQNLMGLSPSGWFRVIWGLCGLFVVVVVGLVIWRKSQPAQAGFVPAGTLTGVPATVPDAVRTLPTGDLRTPGNSVAGTLSGQPNSAQGSGNSGAMPGTARQALNSGDQAQPPGEDPSARISPRSATEPPAGGPERRIVSVTFREQALRDLLTRNGALQPGASLAAVSVDARGQNAKVSLLQSVDQGATLADARAAVLRAALSAAQTVFATDAGYGRVTVEAKVSIAGGPSQPFFEGDIDRLAIERPAPDVRDEDRFSNAWWATPQAPNSQTGP